MNNNRRKQIDEALAKLAEAREAIESARDEEQEYFDNMPESFQQGDRGQKAEEAVDLLQTACDQLEEIESSLQETKN